MIVTYDDAVLRRLAEQQREAPFADDVLRLLDALEEARATAALLEERIARMDEAGPGYARFVAGDTPDDVERKLAIAFAPVHELRKALLDSLDSE